MSSTVRFDPSGALRGEYTPPADKSISHRAALFGAMCDEPMAVHNYLDSADTQSTLSAVLTLGAGVERDEADGGLLIRGVGLHAPLEATGGLLDVGNAGTLMRLLPGWLAGQPGGVWTLDGDDSIRRRPVDRVVEPLSAMGARLEARDGRFPPLTVTGTQLHGIDYELPVASAQVKSCLLLAGMLASGSTTITERSVSRDHTERLLRRARVPFEREGLSMTVSSVDELELDRIVVPGDPSSAAFIVAAATVVGGSRVVVKNLGLNWTRTGFLRIAQRMGAVILGDLEEPGTDTAEEPVGELDVASAPLEATEVSPEEVPLAIDELTLVALLGACAEGETVVRGAEELRLKESDRIDGVVQGLRGLGSRHRGDGRRLRGARRPGRRCAGARSTRTAITAWPCSAPWRAWPRPRAWRWPAWTPPPSPIPASRPTSKPCWPNLAEMVVAIDGPAGAGKSTVARAAALALGFPYLDSGAMYRAVGLLTLRHGGAASAQAEVLEIELGERVIANGEDVTEAIRAPEVSEAASRVATNPAVREALAGKQKALLASGDWVAEGRDIGTVVAPEAGVKVFLTASPEERARRRAAELGTDVKTVLRDQALRDAQDAGREHSPLAVAPGAVELDTTGLSVDEVVARIVELVEAAR